MHDWSRLGALAAACAAAQSDEAFWTIHDFLFEHQRDLHRENVIAEVKKYGMSVPNLDVAVMDECVEQEKATKVIDEDIKLAVDNQVSSTPTLFVNAVRVSGSASRDQLRTLIRQARAVDAALIP
jgi:protein-disulfide isomerase